MLRGINHFGGGEGAYGNRAASYIDPEGKGRAILIRDGNRYFYVRDEETGEVWNPGWYPSKTDIDNYKCTHGIGYLKIYGEKNAPIVAAMLDTGLCADCTMLEADGENLIMYRHAQGGNITAKIKCLTKPQMAMVRTKSESSDIIVSGGKGIAENIEKLEELARKLNAEIGASRGLVDMNKASYDKQIGLTGKTVSPKIYIAVGISDAILHTCAIEGSGTIISINPDKDAGILEYADYGVIDCL